MGGAVAGGGGGGAIGGNWKSGAPRSTIGQSPNVGIAHNSPAFSNGRLIRTLPKSSCIDCHTPDHSAEYAGNEDAYLEKIVHWRRNDSAESKQ